MTRVNERRAQSLSNVLTHVRAIAKEWSPTAGEPKKLWFRGEPQSEYTLLPGLYRESNEPFNYNEENLFERFKARGAPFAGSKVVTD